MEHGKPMELSTAIWCTQTTNEWHQNTTSTALMRLVPPAKAPEVPAGPATSHATWAHLSFTQRIDGNILPLSSHLESQ